MLESGFKISDLQSIPTTGRNCSVGDKIAFDNTFILSYSHTVYGINYNKHNYKIPLNSLRNDIKGYIGIESINAPWTSQLKFWHGEWDTTNKNRSYTYIWSDKERNDPDYNPDKFTDLSNSYYIINDAPFPFETEETSAESMGEDPSETISEGNAYAVKTINLPKRKAEPEIAKTANKLVTKSYVDERLASKRIVEVGTEFTVRDYDCVYVIRNKHTYNKDIESPITIKIHYPKEVNERILHNRLAFDLLIEGWRENEEDNWVSPLSHNLSWEMIPEWLDTSMQPVWVNEVGDRVPNLNNDNLFGNAQYLFIRIETITNKIETISKKERTDAGQLTTAFDKKVDFSIIALCENVLYRSDGIKTVNNIEASALDIISSDSTINVDSYLDGPIVVDLKSNTNIVSNNNYIISEKKDNGRWELTFNDSLLVDTTSIESLNDFIKVDKSLTDDTWTLEFDVSKIPNNVSLESLTTDLIEVKEKEKGSGNWTIAFKGTIPNETSIKPNDNYITVSGPSASGEWGVGFNPDAIQFPEIPECTKHIKNIVKYTNSINLLDTYQKVYWTDTLNPTISFINAPAGTNETLEIGFYYKTSGSNTSVINSGSITWVMSSSGQSPNFVPNRLYYITFTYVPAVNGLTSSSKIYGKINWFTQL